MDKFVASSVALVQMRPLLMGMARRELWNDACAEDVVSETILTALERSDTFGARSTFQTWVVGILKHKIIDVQRKWQREVPMAEPSTTDEFDDSGYAPDQAASPPHIPSELSEPESRVSEREFLQLMQSCIDRLPATASEAFVMRACLDYSTEEICAALSISPSNCHVIMFRTRLRLRESVTSDDRFRCRCNRLLPAQQSRP